MDKIGLRIGISLCLLFFLVEWVSAQSPVRHYPPTFLERDNTEILEFEVQQLGDGQVAEALLFVRSSDRSSYSQQEARFENSRILFPLLVEDATINSMEYYLVLHLTDGREVTYPAVHQGEAPLRVDVVEQEDDSAPTAGFIDYTILSPEPGEILDANDVLVAITFFYDERDVEGGTFHISMNGTDVTEEAEITPFMVRFRPDSLADGEKQLQVTFQRDDEEYQVASWDFRVLEGQEAYWGNFGPERQRAPSGDIELGARNQQIAGLNHDALTGRFQVSGREGDLAYSARSYLTSQETRRMQPQNRFDASIRYGNWLHLQAGDVYPYFSNLSVSGRRVRGVNAALELMEERLEIQVLAGRLNRRITPLYQNIEFEEEEINGEVVDTLYTLQFREQGRASFAQKLIGGRVAWGHRDRFRIAAHALKIEDDTTSVQLIRNYQDILVQGYNLNGNLRESDLQNLEQNPDKLQLMGTNPRPYGNFVGGTELMLSMDDDRVRFSSEGGFSFLNQNITGGPLNRQKAEELGLILNTEAESLFDRLSRFIIINEQMDSPPFRYVENEQGDLELETFFPTSVLAGDSRLNLAYFDHQVQLRYRWIGPDYYSLANSTVRRDIAGINITDRFRLFENRVYITIGYENLRDNLMDQLEATLKNQTYHSSISWHPVDTAWPRLNLSTRYTNWNNRIPRFNPYVADQDPELENAAVRNYRELDGEVLPAPFPRLRNTFSLNFSATQHFELFDENHQVNFNYGILNTGDRSFAYGDNKNQNFSLRLTSRINDFRVPFRTRAGLSYTQSESTGGLSNIRIYGVDAGGETFLIDGRLNLTMDLALTGNRFSSIPLTINEGEDPLITEDDFYEPGDKEDEVEQQTRAWIIRAGAEYEFSNRHSVEGRMNLTNVNDPLQTRSLPDDHILQLRYNFRF